LPAIYIWQGINNQNIQGAQKTKLPQNQWPNEEIVKRTEQNFFKGRSMNDQKTEMLNIPKHKGNENRNHIKIPPYSCQNGT
jgi:hypothetical protein